MASKILRTLKFNIPFCRMLYPDDGEPMIEIRNPRTKKTETIPISDFVSWIVHEAAKRPA